MLLNNQLITEEVKEEIKIPRNKWQWKHNDSKPKAVLGGKLITLQSFLTKTRKISNNVIWHLKQLEKEEQTKPKVDRKEEVIKIRAEINEIEMKKTIENINETKS